MDKFLSSILSLFILMPFLAYVLVFLTTKYFTGNHKKAVQWAIDTTTFFLFICLQFMIVEIWGGGFVWFFYIGILFVAIIFSLYYWKKEDEIRYGRLIRGIWRLQFLLFFLMYVSLMILGVTTSIIQTIS